MATAFTRPKRQPTPAIFKTIGSMGRAHSHATSIDTWVRLKLGSITVRVLWPSRMVEWCLGPGTEVRRMVCFRFGIQAEWQRAVSGLMESRGAGCSNKS
jgi:hypothetical protein